MTTFDAAAVQESFGYHPVTSDLQDLLTAVGPDQLLVLGPGLGDVVDEVGETRHLTGWESPLPRGIYWFCGAEPSAVLAVHQGRPAGNATSEPAISVVDGSALDHAARWMESLWAEAAVVPAPRFGIGERVVVTANHRDGLIMAPRRYVGGQWTYQVSSGNEVWRHPEPALAGRPQVDDPSAWVRGGLVTPRRFSATLTRAKLAGQFTDTMFSFRATRTSFRPYQFKPVQKLLETGALRLLIADEVGLGKTIEAGLVWTEMEARKQADRVMVVCPSALVSKWQREMEERFGFELVELTGERLLDLVDRLESDRVPRRIAYVCSIERLRTWKGLERASDLGFHLDLVIVDEAHAFRNSDTKSYGLGEHLQGWADALVMLSATPVNLRNRDLFNLLSLLVPGEFEDLEALEGRLEPNRVLNRLTRSLLDPDVDNTDRRRWLRKLHDDPFGRVLTQRPDFAVMLEHLAKSDLAPSDAVHVKRICAELHGLSAQVTRTRKVEIQEEKPLRDPSTPPQKFTAAEQEFYDAFYQWCVERARLAGTPLHFAMQMPLRLAGSCLPEAAASVVEWTAGEDSVAADDDSDEVPPISSADLAPGPRLVRLARGLETDSKYDAFERAATDLVRQGKRTIVFTFSRRTLRYLQGRIGNRLRIGVLHGAVPKRHRDEVMRSFREGDFDLLLATKVASEGLDFEFCSAVVNYDLPWNPMEVEQRIGRIDRIGQREQKIAILNFHTPGTIESDIIERVMDRIGVFEHAIGELEPILSSAWREVQDVIFDFRLSPQERDRRREEIILALEAQAQALDELESSAPLLVSSDGAEIDGLERDLLSSGRYVGQPELAVLLRDWADTFGGEVREDGSIIELRGNDEMAAHARALAASGDRSGHEIADIVAQLQDHNLITLSLDQEHSRLSGIDLLTATHPLTLAAVSTPGYRQGRFTRLDMDATRAGVATGTYLTLLAVASWDGLRPMNEIWASTIDLTTMTESDEGIGAAVMRELAEGTLSPGPYRGVEDLDDALELAGFNLQLRSQARSAALSQENEAFLETRRLSFEQVHERRLRNLTSLLAKHRQRGNEKVIRPTEARVAKEERRFSGQLISLRDRSDPSLKTNDLAVCVVEVRA